MCRVLRFPGCVRLCRTVGFRMESWTCSGFLRLRIAISPGEDPSGQPHRAAGRGGAAVGVEDLGDDEVVLERR